MNMSKKWLTRVERENQISMVKGEIEALTYILKPVTHKDTNKVLERLLNERKSMYNMLQETHEWHFNFVGGGWNTVWAHTQEEAIEMANAKYLPGLVPDVNTFG